MGNMQGFTQLLSQFNPEMGKAIGAIMPSSAGQDSKMGRPRRQTRAEREYETAQREVDRMRKESVKFEAPESYAKFAKMQRQILKMEKELKVLKEKADRS